MSGKCQSCMEGVTKVFVTATMYPPEFEEVKRCVQAGGSIKTKCTGREREVAGGCSLHNFCCCTLKDGTCATALSWFAKHSFPTESTVLEIIF